MASTRTSGTSLHHGVVQAVIILIVFLNTRDADARYYKKDVNPMYAPSALCFGYTADGMPPFRYDKETRRCYMVGERGPCGEMMRFSMVDADYGACDCDHTLRCGRPLIYWPRTKRCYYVNDQGPCASGKWLVFGFNLTPVCKTNRCLNEEKENPSKGKKFWFTYQGKCYKTMTQGYCKPGQTLHNNLMEYRPTCNTEPACEDLIPGVRMQTTACLPGSVKDYLGRCKRSFLYKS